jgi:hypothetical protein
MFLQSCREFVELEPLRGTSSIGAAKLSPVTNLVVSTGSVSRYKLYWSQRFIKVQEHLPAGRQEGKKRDKSY